MQVWIRPGTGIIKISFCNNFIISGNGQALQIFNLRRLNKCFGKQISINIMLFCFGKIVTLKRIRIFFTALQEGNGN